MAKMTSVRLSDDLAARVEQLAVALDRSKAWVIEQALTRYVDEEAWQVEAIIEALAEYRRGDATVRSHAEVMASVEARIRERVGDADPLA